MTTAGSYTETFVEVADVRLQLRQGGAGDTDLVGLVRQVGVSDHDRLVVRRPGELGWRQRLAVSARFDRREDWCRVSSAEAR